MDSKMSAMEERLMQAVFSMQPKKKSAPTKPVFTSKNSTKEYCYIHGRSGHSVEQCKTMLNDRSTFSNRMIKAKSPTEVPGGNPNG